MGIGISKEHARRFLLAYQGLRPSAELRGKQAILDHIMKVGCIQFDPLDIVGKNAELVLQSRIGNFRRTHLSELLYDERRLVDGWDKMMSIYRVEDWPYFYASRKRYRTYYGDPSKPANSIIPDIRIALRERGPLSSIDLNYDQRIDWHWAPTRMARAALESMYSWGELVVHHKIHTRKIYDLAERHIRTELLQAPNPFGSADEYLEWHVTRRIGGIGMLWERSGDGWLGIHGLKAGTRKRILKKLTAKKTVVELSIDGIDRPFYILARDCDLLERLEEQQTEQPPARAAVIAPLDNLLWDRKMIDALFGFKYVWEVYKPEKDRTYGYYVLPILYGDRFISRFEPGRDKSSGKILIKNWWWEPDVRETARMRRAIGSCMNRLIRLLGASGLDVSAAAAEKSGIGWLRRP